MRVKVKLACALIIANIFAPGCPPPVQFPFLIDPDDHTPGAIYRVEHLGSPSALSLHIMLWWADIEELVPINQAIDLYKVYYWTSRYDGAPIVASGLLAMPAGGVIRGVVSYQHGTTCHRDYVPSSLGVNEGTLGASIFGGSGFLFAAADYIGLGASNEVHPYLHSQSEVNAILHLLLAANTLTEYLHRSWSNNIYLIGFSQGGHATMAAHRALESLNDPRFKVAASAPVAGPYDLAGCTFPNTLTSASKGHCVCVAYLVNAYCSIYGYPIDSVFKAKYARLLPALFDGTHYSFQIDQAFPSCPRDMFSSQFLDDYKKGRPTWLLAALEENEVYKWTPRAPIHLFYGESDVMVSPEEARAVAAELRSRGADVQLYSVGDYDHLPTIIHSAPMIRRWFSQISTQLPRR